MSYPQLTQSLEFTIHRNLFVKGFANPKGAEGKSGRNAQRD